MDRTWKLLVAVFVIVASQAVMFVGMMMGDDAMVSMIATVSGLIGIAVGILLGVSAILSRKTVTFSE